MKPNKYKSSVGKRKVGRIRGLIAKTQRNTFTARNWARRRLTNLHQVIAAYRPADLNNAGGLRGIMMLD